VVKIVNDLQINVTSRITIFCYCSSNEVTSKELYRLAFNWQTPHRKPLVLEHFSDR